MMLKVFFLEKIIKKRLMFLNTNWRSLPLIHMSVKDITVALLNNVWSEHLVVMTFKESAK